MKPKLLFIVAILFLLAACQPAAPTAAVAPASTPASTSPASPTSIPATAYPTLAAASPTAPAPTAPAATQASASGPIQLTDGLNRSVSLAKPATRVVSMAPSVTEILYAVGAGPQVVGRDEFSDYPAEAKALPSIGGSMGKYDFEAIAALKPDLVIAAGINTPDQVKSLENLGLTVYYLANPTDLNGMYGELQIVGKLTGQDAQAAALIPTLKARVDAVTAKIAPLQNHPRVYYELDASDPTKPYTSGPGTFVDKLISLAGGQNIGSDLKDAWAQIGAEAVIAKNPQVILLGDGAYGITPQSVSLRAGWSAIDAVKNNQVFVFDDNTVSRPTPRLVDGLETLAKLIHPEAFK